MGAEGVEPSVFRAKTERFAVKLRPILEPALLPRSTAAMTVRAAHIALLYLGRKPFRPETHEVANIAQFAFAVAVIEL